MEQLKGELIVAFKEKLWFLFLRAATDKSSPSPSNLVLSKLNIVIQTLACNANVIFSVLPLFVRPFLPSLRKPQHKEYSCLVFDTYISISENNCNDTFKQLIEILNCSL